MSTLSPFSGGALSVAVMVIAATVAIAQDHSYTPADIENGSRLYQSSCLGCHGPTGDDIPGVDLMHGQFRRATSDTEIAAIIRSGIPGTAMPPSGFSETEAGTIVAFLRSLVPASSRAGGGADLARGNASRGRTMFEGKGECASCHRVNGVGPRVAPDLSDIGAIRTAMELQQKILDPNALVRAGNHYVEAVTKDGATITGRLLNYDSFSIQLIDSNERLRSLPKSTLRDYTIIKTSKMPSYRDKLTTEEVTDLVSYLFSLRGGRP
jgi:putative heme-binding domain-containing protein